MNIIIKGFFFFNVCNRFYSFSSAFLLHYQLANTPAQAKLLLYCQEQAAIGISLCRNSNKTEFTYFYQDGAIASLTGKPLKQIHRSIYFSSNISSTEKVNSRIGKAWFIIDRLLTIWKSDLSNKIKQEFFQTEAMSVLPYGCTT